MTFALALVFAAAFLLFTLARVVRNDFLDAEFYTNALEENRVYDRFYEEVLSDPELAEIASEFLGDIEIERTFAVSALRLVLPPDVLRQATEAVIADLIAYLRGDIPRFETFVEVTGAIGLQRLALSEYYQERFAALPATDDAGTDIERFAQSLSQNLAEGRLPESLPATSVPPDAIAGIADALLGPVNDVISDAVKSQVVAALTVDDIRSAIAIAAPYLLGSTLEEAEDGLREYLGPDGGLDPVVVLSDVSGLTEEEILAPLNDVRDELTILFSPWLSSGMIALMIVAVVAMVSWSPSVRSGVRTTGIVLTTVAMIVLVVEWQAGPGTVSLATGAPVESTIRPETGVPESVSIILRDVSDTLLDELSDTVRTAALFLLVPGLIALAASYVWRRRIDFVLRQPYWERAMKAVAVAVLLVVTVAVFDAVTPERQIIADAPRCNGSVELCDRAYDEVVFPATHNSMSSASMGWLLPSHDRDIQGQLDDGVRAFLIDTHYWTEARDAADALVARGDLDAATVEAFGEIIGRFGEGPPGAWLCHRTCWLGATNLVETLAGIRVFMHEHPQEVVTLIIQDAISVEDTVAAFDEAGLLPFLHEQSSEAPWPTLRSMIESGRRLVVLSEESGPPPAWNHRAFDLMQETPAKVESLDGFTCAEGRGPSTAALFQMNNWVVKPSPDRVDAARANDFDFLMARARRCESERGQLPNFIAVNFHTLGDLFDVVDELNGVR